MKQSTEKALIDLLLRHAAEQNEILKIIQASEPADEFVRIREVIGKTMGALYVDALQPIFVEHADLKPAALL